MVIIVGISLDNHVVSEIQFFVEFRQALHKKNDDNIFKENH
jgi:hypothetical protein